MGVDAKMLSLFKAAAAASQFVSPAFFTGLVYLKYYDGIMCDPRNESLSVFDWEAPGTDPTA